MNLIRNRRESLGLTQQEAAGSAGVSLATWCRLESGGDEVRARSSTISAFERVLKLPKGGLSELQAGREAGEPSRLGADLNTWLEQIAKSFTGIPLTARQAFKIAISSSGMEDDDVNGWNDYVAGQSTISQVSLLRLLPDWVLFTVNTHWLERFKDCFIAIGDQIARGNVPHTHCVAERVALQIALWEALERSDEIDDEMLDESGYGTILEPNLEHGEEWDSVEGELLGGHDNVALMWGDGFTEVVFGGGGPEFSEQTGINLGRFLPVRWWERDSEVDGKPEYAASEA
ncbi:XRE family transcriptional regulator [Rhodococcus erythropolis]|uniref:helix-turn-helix domain-containing protein n=1 Tax=Rhodococcus erythropolis TaxID=1833 RepID=UPI001F2F1F0D|nr:helix-turn-helix domain-containing protein [Rhodococcus erythropolis]UJC79253.1 XRE family transcriptional regulator [Rhodococcus erythropolis]